MIRARVPDAIAGRDDRGEHETRGCDEDRRERVEFDRVAETEDRRPRRVDAGAHGEHRTGEPEHGDREPRDDRKGPRAPGKRREERHDGERERKGDDRGRDHRSPQYATNAISAATPMASTRHAGPASACATIRPARSVAAATHPRRRSSEASVPSSSALAIAP